eukprot:scaffold106045_cov56-Attheya_sp.AAC.4
MLYGRNIRHIRHSRHRLLLPWFGLCSCRSCRKREARRRETDVKGDARHPVEFNATSVLRTGVRTEKYPAPPINEPA